MNMKIILRRFYQFFLLIMVLLPTPARAMEYLANFACASQNNGSCKGSIQNILTTIGTVNKAVIKLDNSKKTTTIYYILSDVDWSAYTNVTLRFVPGAVLLSRRTLP